MRPKISMMRLTAQQHWDEFESIKQSLLSSGSWMI
nr:hypothetical protein [Vibrio sp. B172a]